MATAYAGIANGGVVCSPIAIDKVVDGTGAEVAAPASHCSQAVTPAIAAAMARALRQVILTGTAAPANPGGPVDVLAKTGTTDNAEQLWLVASSTEVATALWTGNVTGHTSLRSFSVTDASGRSIRASLLRNPVVRDIMGAANSKYGGGSFAPPPASMVHSTAVIVPDLTGKSSDEARVLLEGAGLRYADGGVVTSAQSSGTVASTEPIAGSPVTKGSTVIVRISEAGSARPSAPVPSSAAPAAQGD
jgi:membrane peptidoglycan carboxypeptidase